MQLVAQHVGGQIIHNAAIHKIVAVRAHHGRENTGNRDGCANSLGERPGRKVHRMESVQVSGYTAKRDGELVVIQILGVVGKEFTVQKLVHATVGKQCVAKAQPVLETEPDGLGNLAAVLAAAKAGIGIRCLNGEDAGDRVAEGQGAQLCRGAPSGVECSH